MLDETEISEEWKYEIPPSTNKYFKGKVTLYHGPYEALHVIKHRPQRLRGLKDLLTHEGYIVTCLRWEHYDRMGVQVNDSIIYTCKYSNMDFDGFGECYNTKEAFRITMEIWNRINAWHLIKHFKEKSPHDFFSRSIGF